MNLTKKQVGALLKIMSKDNARPALCGVSIGEYDGQSALCATDGYRLVALKLDDEQVTEIQGKFIRRTAIEKWYKLATGKSRLDEKELVYVSGQDYADNDNTYQENKYPKFESIIPTGEPIPQGNMKFNAQYMVDMQDLDDSVGVSFDLYGPLKPMVYKNNNGVYVVMPMKR